MLTKLFLPLRKFLKPSMAGDIPLLGKEIYISTTSLTSAKILDVATMTVEDVELPQRPSNIIVGQHRGIIFFKANNNQLWVTRDMKNFYQLGNIVGIRNSITGANTYDLRFAGLGPNGYIFWQQGATSSSGRRLNVYVIPASLPEGNTSLSYKTRLANTGDFSAAVPFFFTNSRIILGGYPERISGGTSNVNVNVARYSDRTWNDPNIYSNYADTVSSYRGVLSNYGIGLTGSVGRLAIFYNSSQNVPACRIVNLSSNGLSVALQTVENITISATGASVQPSQGLVVKDYPDNATISFVLTDTRGSTSNQYIANSNSCSQLSISKPSFITNDKFHYLCAGKEFLSPNSAGNKAMYASHNYAAQATPIYDALGNVIIPSGFSPIAIRTEEEYGD